MTPSELRKRTFIGVVEDNLDPKKLGRCRCRVLNVFDEIPVEDLPWASPWKDLNGNQFIVPDKGKVVSIVFDEGNIYKPEYIFANHYNANLEQKLQELSGNNYTSMRALMFDHKTQIYVNDEEGLKLDHKFNNINITESSIDVNLKDNFGKVNLGSQVCDQQAILGTNFLEWFDRFLNNLLSNGFLGNLAAPLVPTPQLIADVIEYQNMRDLKFLSHHVSIVDNNWVINQERIANGQVGDAWKSTTNKNDSVSVESTSSYEPQQGLTTDTPPGQLTTSEDLATQTLSSSQEGKEAIEPSTHPDVEKIIKAIERKREAAKKDGKDAYKIFTKPYELNIVGVRRQYEGMAYSNKFVDSLVVFWKTTEDGPWQQFKCTITTVPGVYQGVENGSQFTLNRNGNMNVKASQKMQGRGGIGHLAPGYYPNQYRIGLYKNSPALIDNGGLLANRDKTPENKITYTSKGGPAPGFLVHKGPQNGVYVDNWSEGCQVFKVRKDIDYFISLCREHEKRHGNSFTYTLLEERTL